MKFLFFFFHLEQKCKSGDEWEYSTNVTLFLIFLKDQMKMWEKWDES